MTHCRHCKTPVIWCDTIRLRRIPVTANPDGDLVLSGDPEFGPMAFPAVDCDPDGERFGRHECGGAG